MIQLLSQSGNIIHIRCQDKCGTLSTDIGHAAIEDYLTGKRVSYNALSRTEMLVIVKYGTPCSNFEAVNYSYHRNLIAVLSLNDVPERTPPVRVYERIPNGPQHCFLSDIGPLLIKDRLTRQKIEYADFYPRRRVVARIYGKLGSGFEAIIQMQRIAVLKTPEGIPFGELYGRVPGRPGFYFSNMGLVIIKELETTTEEIPNDFFGKSFLVESEYWEKPIRVVLARVAR